MQNVAYLTARLRLWGAFMIYQYPIPDGIRLCDQLNGETLTEGNSTLWNSRVAASKYHIFEY